MFKIRYTVPLMISTIVGTLAILGAVITTILILTGITTFGWVVPIVSFIVGILAYVVVAVIQSAMVKDFMNTKRIKEGMWSTTRPFTSEHFSRRKIW